MAETEHLQVDIDDLRLDGGGENVEIQRLAVRRHLVQKGLEDALLPLASEQRRRLIAGPGHHDRSSSHSGL